MPARRLEAATWADPLVELAELLAAMADEQLAEFMDGLTAADLDVVEQALSMLRHQRWEPLPYQVPPGPDEAWLLWLLLGGRGTGKTDACAHAMDQHAKGPPCMPHLPGGHRMAIIAPTLGDASDACVHGPSGLMVHNPSVVERTRKGGTFVTWPGGAEAKLFGAYTKQDVERLRAGGNRCFVWAEELAAWRYLRACWNHMRFGLRLGPHPRVIASTTPKNRPHLKRLIAAATTVVSKGRTRDNPHLAPEVRQAYEDEFGGTRLGRQELDGEVLDDVEGALWTFEDIEVPRLIVKRKPGDTKPVAEVPTMRRIVIGVDPSWGTTNDECGIVVCGVGWDGEGYVLADYSIRGGPRMWAERVAEAYWTWQADMVLAERNFQGEQVQLAMAAIEHPQGSPPFDFVNASRGKQLRAEPIVLKYQQGRVHHVGVLTLLEEQMLTWVPGAPPDEDAEEDAGGAPEPLDESESDDDVQLPSNWSPDRVDALVFALTDLLYSPGGPASIVLPRAAGAGGASVRRPSRPGRSRG